MKFSKQNGLDSTLSQQTLVGNFEFRGANLSMGYITGKCYKLALSEKDGRITIVCLNTNNSLVVYNSAQAFSNNWNLYEFINSVNDLPLEAILKELRTEIREEQ